jgi:hypothetical protein
VAVVAWWCRPEPDAGRWQRGAQGEVATAQLLARLPRRYVVMHDRRGWAMAGNIDHLVVGPTGVWVVDSKVRRATLRVHRGRVWAGQEPIDVAPVAAQARRVEQALGVPVGAVIAVHGQGLRRRGKRVGGVRVLPAPRLVHRLRRLPRLHRLPRLRPLHRLGRLRRGRRLPTSVVVALAADADRQFPRC